MLKLRDETSFFIDTFNKDLLMELTQHVSPLRPISLWYRQWSLRADFQATRR